MTIRGFARLKSGENGTIPQIDSENKICYLNFESWKEGEFMKK